MVRRGDRAPSTILRIFSQAIKTERHVRRIIVGVDWTASWQVQGWATGVSYEEEMMILSISRMQKEKVSSSVTASSNITDVVKIVY